MEKNIFDSDDLDNVLKVLVSKFDQLGITRLANISGLDDSVFPVYTCIRPESRHLSTSLGKGVTHKLAKVSTIMEAVEAYHLENPPIVDLKAIAYNQLEANAIQPSTLTAANLINKNIDDIATDWIKAKTIVNQDDIYIPSVLSTIDSTKDLYFRSFIQTTSNGTGAHSNFESALTHALCELIERDSLYYWSKLENISATSINFDTVEDDNINNLLELFKSKDLACQAWSLYKEGEVPAFQCCLYDKNPLAKSSIFTGSCANVDKNKALLGAMMETLQLRTALVSGSRDDIFEQYYLQQQHMKQQVMQAEIPQGNIDFKSLKNFHNDFDNINFSLAKYLISKGYEDPIVIDHTKAELGIPMVQVVIPSMSFNTNRML